MTLGQRLRMLRDERNLSREELAKNLGITYWALSKYENDDRVPDKDTLLLIADFFNVTLDFLFGRTDIRTSFRVAESPTPYNPEIQAAHRTDDPMDELPEEARKSLEEFKAYIIDKYKKK